MQHPILPFMPAVFLPVSNLKRSTEWYADLLEQPIVPRQDGGGIYYFDFDGTDMILDSNAWGFPPTIMFDTQRVDESRAFCETLPHGFITDIQRLDEVSFFNINSIMVCKAHRAPESDRPKPAHALLNRISRVIVHAEQLTESIGWYETFLDRKAETDAWIHELPLIRMDRGAHLLIDDNRLCQSPRVFYERLQLDLRVNPVAIIETVDIEAAHEYVISKGAQVERGIEERLGVRFFIFYDPDHNGLMVCEK
ncbi:VOC family protein [Cohnella nanjingensis]|uniref:VOC domain-containing protein n=1 Tax=Cohnella nanjingensis TaxID=1387779 RepID=A0A7X0RQS4_9BACL|nr:hypothetical protein [Cohnella nanjingensis]MBB6671826.1 hypothetical protein [Cohnella nanjingensis]